MVWSTANTDGDMVAMMTVLQRPPSDSCSRRVNLESLSTDTQTLTQSTHYHPAANTHRDDCITPTALVSPVRNALAASLPEQVYHPSQSEQRLVDVLALPLHLLIDLVTACNGHNCSRPHRGAPNRRQPGRIAGGGGGAVEVGSVEDMTVCI